MIPLDDEKIATLAEDIECGFTCYYNPTTGETKSIMAGADEWMDDEDTEEEEDLTDFVEIEKMSSTENFDIMRDFAEQVSDASVQRELIRTLERSKPFRNFKDAVDESGPFRDEWFKFKRQRYVEYVRDQVSDV